MNNPMTPQKAADREMIGLPELPERCDLRHDQLGYFMKMLPNGEFVRWHRYIEVRSIAEAALKRIQELEDLLKNSENRRQAVFLKYALCDSALPEDFEPEMEPDKRLDAFVVAYTELAALKEGKG